MRRRVASTNASSSCPRQRFPARHRIAPERARARRAGVNAEGEIFQLGRPAARQQAQQFKRCAGDLADSRQPGGIELGGGFRANPRQPLVRQGGQIFGFLSRRDQFKGRRFPEFGSNLADQFVGGDALADRKLERLPDGETNGLGNACRRLGCSRQIEVTFVNRADFDVRGEIVGVGNINRENKLVFLKIARQQNQFGAQPARQRGRIGV